MKTYLFSFLLGCAVGVFYALCRVKSPAPPIVALLGGSALPIRIDRAKHCASSGGPLHEQPRSAEPRIPPKANKLVG
jgi:hypothetical protein